MADTNAADEAVDYRAELERRIIGWTLRGDFNALQHTLSARGLCEAFQRPHDKIMAAIFAAADAGADTSAAAIALRLARDPDVTTLGGLEYLRAWAFGAPALISEADAQRHIEQTVAEYRRIASGDSREVCLSLERWLARDIAPPDYLLAELLSTTSRMLLVGPTGLGKTNIALAIVFGMASGNGFQHWRSPRRARVLYVDGEMSRRLMKIRLADAARRQGENPSTFFALCRDDIPDLPPLNTFEGQEFINGIIDKIGGVDFIIFDSIMSLLAGDMKEELPWAETLPWIKRLTQRNIGQCWIHHTGHDQSRSYGTSTREWQLDTVALLEAVERPGADIAFAIKFTKSRERAPHNRADFEPTVITLSQDRWESETNAILARPGKKPSPKALAFHVALVEALTKAGELRPESVNQPSVTLDQWAAECDRRGLIDREGQANKQRAMLSKYRLELIAAGWAVCAGNFIWNRTVAP